MIFLTRNGVLDDTAEQQGQFDALTAALTRPGAKMLLHLHGGLVPEENGVTTAIRLAGVGGWGLPDDWTQVYCVWRTGAFETLRTNWIDLARNDRLYRAVVAKLIEFVGGKLGGSGPGRGTAPVDLSHDEIMRRLNGGGDLRNPFAVLDASPAAGVVSGRGPIGQGPNDMAMTLDFQELLARDVDFNAAVADIDAVVNDQAAGRGPAPEDMKLRGDASLRWLSASVKGPMELARAEAAKTPTAARGPIGVAAFLLKHAGKVAYRVFKRFRSGRDHGAHATIVEEVARELYGDLIGNAIWGMMVQDAADHFTAGKFGRQLLDALPEANPVHIVVTAHSAGSIWTTHLLKAIAASGRPITVDLVLLAPAVRSDLFASALNDAQTHIGRCRMFTMSDRLERADAVLGHQFGYIYPSSLLYLVSGLFEHLDKDGFVDAPLLGMQRFVSAAWQDADQVKVATEIAAFFRQPGHDIIYSPSPGMTVADSHGGFDTEATTLKSVARFCLETLP